MLRKHAILRYAASFSMIISNEPKATMALKLIKIGTFTGAILPKEKLSRLKVEKRQLLFAIETMDGYMITPYDPAIEAQLKAGREFMNEYRDTFKALAK